METKQCKQCGEIKPLSSFRRYYNGTGTYTACLSCEKINSRRKYLLRKGDKATQSDLTELSKIEQLYEYQRLVGLKPPCRRAEHQKALEDLGDLLSKYKDAAETGPTELNKWLTVELTESPEYYLDTVYEELLAKYKPVIRIDTTTLMPVYDNTYADTLNQILERFNAYEDKYYN